MKETALVIINMQEAWRDKASEYYMGNLDGMVEKINYLIAYARELDYKIIFVQHLENEGPFSAESPYSAFISDLAMQEEDFVLQKHHISSYYQTELEKELEGIKNLVVCGALTNLCVRMFVEESYDRGFTLALLENLTFTFTSELQDFTLEDLHNTRPTLNILPLEKFVE